MPLGTILLIILVLLLIGALPSWPYSAGWVPHRKLTPETGGSGASRFLMWGNLATGRESRCGRSR